MLVIIRTRQKKKQVGLTDSYFLAKQREDQFIYLAMESLLFHISEFCHIICDESNIGTYPDEPLIQIPPWTIGESIVFIN